MLKNFVSHTGQFLIESTIVSGRSMILMKKAIERTNPTSAMLVATLVGSIAVLHISLFTIPLSYLKSVALLFVQCSKSIFFLHEDLLYFKIQALLQISCRKPGKFSI